VDKRSAAEAGVSFVGVGAGTEARWAEAGENLCLIFCNMAVCQQLTAKAETTSHSFRNGHWFYHWSGTRSTSTIGTQRLYVSVPKKIRRR
jgi:hypothetical protein